jgi:hypothetical protein
MDYKAISPGCGSTLKSILHTTYSKDSPPFGS